MIFTDKTIETLKSFSIINNTLTVKAGNEITVIQSDKYLAATGNRIAAKAEVEETFPQDWCVYNLPVFLKLIEMHAASDIEFKDTHIQITQGTNITKYPYSLIHKQFNDLNKPNKNIVTTPNFAMTLTLTAAMIKHIQRVASTLGLDIFEIQDGQIEIRASTKSLNSPIQVITVETEGDVLDGNPYLFNVSCLKLLENSSYEVSLTKNYGLFTNLGESKVSYQMYYTLPKKDD